MVNVTVTAIITILAGLAVLFWPKIFRIVLGVYLLIVGILQLF